MYLSSKHQSTGDLGRMRYPNRLLSNNLPLRTCNYPFYSAYNSLNHRVNLGQFKLCTDIWKNPGPSVYIDAAKAINAPYCQGNYNSFILTVAITGVGIYSIEAGGYNLFDSHARDMYHNSDSEGTCIVGNTIHA